MLLNDPRNLNNALLRKTYEAVRDRSYRLTRWHRALADRYLRWRLEPPVRDLVHRYQTGKVAFGVAKDALAAAMQRVATVRYF